MILFENQQKNITSAVCIFVFLFLLFSFVVVQFFQLSSCLMSGCLGVYVVDQMSSCLVVLLSSCLDVQLSGCLVVLLSSCLVVQLSSCLVVQLSSCLPRIWRMGEVRMGGEGASRFLQCIRGWSHERIYMNLSVKSRIGLYPSLQSI